MGLVLFILYLAIALWIYALLGLRQVVRNAVVNSTARGILKRLRKRRKRLLLAFVAASATILFSLLILIYLTMNNNNI